MSYRKTAHSVQSLKFHLVWITKYRKPVVLVEVGEPNTQFWARTGGRGYFAASSGNVTDEIIKQTIGSQSENLSPPDRAAISALVIERFFRRLLVAHQAANVRSVVVDFLPAD